jgi:molecular chaperone HscB
VSTPSIPDLDFFNLFGLEPRFALDPQELTRAYQRVQAQVHPDRHAAAAPADRRVALQWATHANEAFRTLKSPLARAAYLCRRAGVATDGGAALAPEFLLQQMEWREALEDGRRAGDAQRLAGLEAQVLEVRERLLHDLTRLIDEAHDYTHASDLVRQLMFVDKFDAEVAAAAGDAALPRAGS